MVGGARTALEVGRLLFSLDPLGDPMGCLLALDSHALASRQGQFLLDLHLSKLPIGLSPSEAKKALESTAEGAGQWCPPPPSRVFRLRTMTLWGWIGSRER